jgi:hypothetical protein
MTEKRTYRTRAERVAIAKEYARALKKGQGVRVLEKYGVTRGSVLHWLRGENLGQCGARRKKR